MERNKKNPPKTAKNPKNNSIESMQEKSWTYIKTIINTAREPILILDKTLVTLLANDSFYQAFQIESSDLRNKTVYELLGDQWDTPPFHELFEKILPKKTFFNGLKMTHIAPLMGERIFILNIRHIYLEPLDFFPSIIMIALQDITEIMLITETLAHHAQYQEDTNIHKIESLEIHIKELKEEIAALKAKS